MFSPSGVATVVSEFVSMIEPEVPVIGGLAGVSSDQIAKITQGLEALKISASALATSDSAAAAQPVVMRVIADGNAVLQQLSTLPLPPNVALTLRIAQMVFGILPTIAALFIH